MFQFRNLALERSSGHSSRLLSVLFVLAVSTMLCAGAFAQSTTDGAIGGTVYDAVGAVVPNAKVVVRNNGTNVEQSVTTDASGYYRVTKLQPGTYTATIHSAGFADYRAENVVVEIGRVTSVDPRLAVSGASETVSVTGETPQVNTESPDFASNVNQVAINNLPINGRRWSNFALLTPGVVSDLNGFGLLSFRGISTLLNNNTVDGADNNQAYFSEERGRTRASYSTSQAAVQEFQVNSSNYSAEYGRAAGGVVNTITKSGTNQLHGQLFFYDRDNGWGATNPFTTLTTNQNGTFVTAPYKPKDWRKQWGFGVGGALIKDKLFWFYSYDQQKRNFPGTARVGNPSAFFTTPAAALPAGKTCSGATAIKASDFNNNTNLFNATSGACSLFTRLNLANYGAGANQYNQGLGLMQSFLGPLPRHGDQTINFPKLDWVINDRNRASFSYNRLRWDSPAGIQTQASNTFGIASFGNDFVKEDWGIARLNTFITNSISNEVRFQYGRDFEFENSQPPSPNEVPLSSNSFGRPPQISIASTTGFQIGKPNFLERGALPDERRTQVADTVTWIRGNHAIKLGEDFNHVSDFISNLFNENGSYSYNTIGDFLSDYYHFTQGLGTFTTSNYSSYSQAVGPRAFEFRTNDYAFFASDDWKIFPRLTVTLGVRYEYEQLPDPLITNPDIPQTQSMPSDKNNFGPRVGFAYDMFGNGRTVVRGGYGMFYGRIINGTLFSALTGSGGPGGQTSFSFNSPTASGAPVFPNIFNALPNVTLSPPNALFLDRNLQNPQIHQTDLIVENQVGWNTVVSLNYLGSYGRQLPNFVDTNLPTPTSITYQVQVPGTVSGLPSPLANGSTYTTLLFPRGRPNTKYNAITDVLSDVNSSYNAFTAEVKHRISSGLQFSANYTWAHALDFNQNSTTGTFSNNVIDPRNLRLEYGNSSFDVRQRFVVNAVYTSLWKASGWLGYLLNDYTIAPIFSTQTGLPYTLGMSGNAPNAASTGVNGSGNLSRVIEIGRNSYRFPNTANIDLRLSKGVTFKEKYRLELLGEAFNLFNHQNVTGINTTGFNICTSGTAQGCPTTASTTNPFLVFNPTFGVVTNSNSNTVYRERQIQLALRLAF